MKDIQYYIDKSNLWLKQNRKNHKIDITLNDIKNRLKKSNFLSLESTKTKKGEILGFYTAILYLAPYKIVGFNMCPMAKNCILDCLFNSGRGNFANVTKSRIIKTLCFLYDKNTFIHHINKDITRLEKKAKKDNFKLTVRLNGTSDLNIKYHFSDTLKRFKNVQFYDYTKVSSYIKNNTFKNYYLLFSYDGINKNKTFELLNKGFSASIVFKSYLPKYYKGFKVVDGDKTDLRFLDKKNVIVGLKYKNSFNKDINTDFVIQN